MSRFFKIYLILFGVSSLYAQQKQPNIIWLMAEDMSIDLACYGMPNVQTPHLDKMAKNGVQFQNCYVTNSICSPSRSAMMIGTHQYKTNTHHHRSNRNIPLNKEFKPFTYWLRKQGYTCVLGNNNVLQKGRKIDVNFKHKAIGDWDGVKHFGLFDQYDVFDASQQPFFAQIQLNVTHRGDWWNEIRSKSKHPVNPNTVILPPYLADDPAIRLDWAKYLDTIEYMDAEVGAIFKELEEKGLSDNTIVIFIGDNGRCNIKGKGYLYDAGLHIPLLVYFPDGKHKGVIRKDVVSATDITASILDFAGINTPDYMTGKPLFGKVSEREFVYARRDLWDEVEEQSSAITSTEWKYIRNDKPQIPFDAHQAYLEFYRPAVHVMRRLNKEGKLNKNQQFFFQKTKPKEELYDLKNDPFELNNLAKNKSNQFLLERFRKKTTQFDLEMMPSSKNYEPVNANAVQVLEFTKAYHPELIKKMEEGMEIGFKKMSISYRKNKKQKTKNKKQKKVFR